MAPKTPQLKPQDVLVLLKVALLGDEGWSYPQLAAALGMSASEVHAAVKRAVVARLAVVQAPRVIRVNAQNLLEFLIHGVKYAFPVARGPITRGHPTGYAAPVMREAIAQGDGMPPIWPDAEGTTRGEAFSPLYPAEASVRAILRDRPLYDAAALVDAIRGGSARERQLASGLLERLLKRPRR